MLRLLRDSEHLAAIDFDKDPISLCDKVWSVLLKKGPDVIWTESTFRLNPVTMRDCLVI